jgi:hypothetical protein
MNKMYLFYMWFMKPKTDTHYVHRKPPQNPRENMGRLSIFEILGAQQQEHHIDPFKGITCHLQGIKLGWGE